jgi:hypothetical protein
MAPASVDGDQVGVRITSDRVPMAGATVFFNRAPHSGCVAKSAENGVARCVLVDQHGDDESHDDHDKVRVVATFPAMFAAVACGCRHVRVAAAAMTIHVLVIRRRRPRWLTATGAVALTARLLS